MHAFDSMSDQNRGRLIAAAGWLIIAMAAVAALLPTIKSVSGATVVGVLLFVAGTIETVAGLFRRGSQGLPIIAGVVTALAGLAFAINPVAHFLPTIYVVSGWLVVRSVVLFLASKFSGGSVRMWMSLSAITDLVLGLVLLAGLSIATLVVSLFGPTPTLIASFAWILALSFIVNGTLLLEVGSCEREAAA